MQSISRISNVLEKESIDGLELKKMITDLKKEISDFVDSNKPSKAGGSYKSRKQFKKKRNNNYSRKNK